MVPKALVFFYFLVSMVTIAQFLKLDKQQKPNVAIYMNYDIDFAIFNCWRQSMTNISIFLFKCLWLILY